MRRRLQRAAQVTIAVSAAIAAVVLQSEAALAATALTSGQWVVPTGVQPATQDYSATATGPYWSAVVFSPGYIQSSDPNTVVDYSMKALDGSGNQLAATTYGPYEPDYVAIDGNIRSSQTYTARVIKNQSNYAGEQYRMVFVNGNTVLNQGTTYIPAATNEPNNAYIRDVYLSAGTSVQITVAGAGVTCPENVGTLYLHAFLLGSNPSVPSTGVQSRNAALTSSESFYQTSFGCGVTLSYDVSRSAWYGLLIFDPDFAQVAINMTSFTPIG